MTTLREEIKRAFAEVDPQGLFGMGCPEDEYDAEVDDVVERLSSGQRPGVQLVFEVMNHWFYTIYDARGRATGPDPDRLPTHKEKILGRKIEEAVEAWNALHHDGT